MRSTNCVMRALGLDQILCGDEMLRRIVVNITLRMILMKSVIFLVPWCILLAVVMNYNPGLVDMEKLVTNLFSNTLCFFICYVLAIVGFQYSSRNDKDK